MTSTTLDPAPPPTRASVRQVDLTQLSRPSFARLTSIELRKSVDYRAGRWILGAILALAVLALGWEVAHASQSPISLSGFLDSSMSPVVLLVPVLGILAMTAEWSQRTALTTFTLSPRRVPVLLAKLGAAMLLSLAVTALVMALTALAVGLSGLLTGDAVTWQLTWKGFGGAILTNLLFVLMGAGFGALIPITGVALTAFFVAPTLFTIASGTFLKKIAEWFDVFGAFDRLSGFALDGKAAQTVTSVGAWIVVPIVVGLWLSVRREVK